LLLLFFSLIFFVDSTTARKAEFGTGDGHTVRTNSRNPNNLARDDFERETVRVRKTMYTNSAASTRDG